MRACVSYAHVTLFVCLEKHCACAQVCVFHLSGTFSCDHLYLAPIALQATHRAGRGEDGVTDSLANSHLLTPVLAALICAESKQSRKPDQEGSAYQYTLPVLNHSSRTTVTMREWK